MFCKNCGKELSDGALFCAGCGTKLDGLTSNNTKSVDSQENEQVEDEGVFEDAYIMGAVGTPARTGAYVHYKNAFKKFKNNEGILSFNWASFLFSMANMLWRKNYIIWIIGTLFFYFGFMGSIIIDIAVMIFTGLFCDYFTWLRYKKVAEQAKSMFPNDNETQISYVAGKGGVNTVGVIVYLIFALILAIAVGLRDTALEALSSM